MRGKTYRVHLTKNEEKRLKDIIRTGVHPARQITRARILLGLNEGEDREHPLPVPEQRDIAHRSPCNTVGVGVSGE
jgi:hypothetical protein